jgi:hypothetical protein
MSVSKRLRYEVLRRDNHACRYCGGTAPDVKLTVDHVTPTALGGSDAPDNLVTACGDCNNGKSATPPGAPLVMDVAADAMRWAQAMQEAHEVRRVARERSHQTRDQLTEWFTAVWHDEFKSDVDLPQDPYPSLMQFVDAGLAAADFVEAVQVSGRNYRKDYWKYFCGVCWGLVRESQDVARAILAREDT